KPAKFTADLAGGAEVPARETPARGEADFRLSADGTELTFRLKLKKITNVVAAHIHLGPAGQNGPGRAFLLRPARPRRGPVRPPAGGSAGRALGRSPRPTWSARWRGSRSPPWSRGCGSATPTSTSTPTTGCRRPTPARATSRTVKSAARLNCTGWTWTARRRSP